LGPVLLLLAVLVGVLIGMVGVGGVLLPPALVVAGGMSAHAATATSTWAFLFTGVVGTVAYAWRGLVPWRMLFALAAGIIPAAFLGARANALLPAPVVLGAIALLTLFVGIHQLLGRAGTARASEPGTAYLVAIGVAVGFGSALTGTGGPVLLVPILLVLGVAPLKAVAVSQVAQLPVVVSGSVGYLQAGLTDISLGTVLGIGAAVGTVAGALIATRLQAERLRQIVALACITTGVLLAIRVVVSVANAH
jgi:uncharacterized membrane protein YfcA